MLSRRGASEAGRLRLQLVLEKAAATPDGAGGATLAWSAAATVFADVTPVRAEERRGDEGVPMPRCTGSSSGIATTSRPATGSGWASGSLPSGA